MNLTLFLMMFAFSGFLIFIAAIKQDDVLIFGAGILLIILGSFTFLTGVQIHTGWDVTETQVDSNTTEITKQKTFTDFKEDSGLEFSREALSLILWSMGIYFSFYAFYGNRFARIFS